MPTHRESLAQALRKARTDAGFKTQLDLAKALHVDRSNIGKAESPNQPVPGPDLVAAVAKATGADADELAELLKRAKNGTPDWFGPYLAAEQSATLLRFWDPMVVTGLFQTEAYARALLSVERYAPERLDDLVTKRLDRQRVIDRARVKAVLDASVLSRRVGTPEIMKLQCQQLAELAERPNISLHVVPEGVDCGTSGAFGIASRGSLTTVNFVALRDIPTTAPDVVDDAMDAFEGILAAALNRDGSLDFVRTWEETWRKRT